MKVTGVALLVTSDRWSVGLITEDDRFQEVWGVIRPNGFPIDSEFATMPLNEALENSLAWVSEDIKDPDEMIDEVIKNLSKLRERSYPTV